MKSIKELREDLEEVDGFSCTDSCDRATKDLEAALSELEAAREVVKAAKEYTNSTSHSLNRVLQKHKEVTEA